MVKTNQKRGWHNVRNSWERLRLWLLLMLLYLGTFFAEGTNTISDLGSIFDYPRVTPFGIFNYPSLRNWNHNMSKIYTYKATM